MSAVARMSPPLPSPTLASQQDHERRFLPSRAALEGFMRATRPWTQACVYDARLPFAFTRTTYFDTEDLRFLDSCRHGQTQRLRLREYAGSATLSEPPVLTGTRYLEMKTNTGQRRTKVRIPVSPGEAVALLAGESLDEDSAAARLLRDSPHGPVIPWVTAWYRRGTYANADASVRFTVDEDLVFAFPPRHTGMGAPATPERLIRHAPAILLEVKWRANSPPWLRDCLRNLEVFETQDSKFEQGMRWRLDAEMNFP
ncbi:VTC domain-containing protein [Cystobacter ferrugineus]|uniref:VTC domain-containing protein n=2 Tax=Cystobacter ferrugineus TaxID=83449 RepID=A0A1L9B6M8_9BACT|nr:VTC domain-containing protein [Cystobacter ferrugineus]